MNQFARVTLRGEPVEAVVGNGGDTNVRLARVGAAVRDIRSGENFEQRSLAHLGQTDDSSLHIDIYRFRVTVSPDFLAQLTDLQKNGAISMINDWEEMRAIAGRS